MEAKPIGSHRNGLTTISLGNMLDERVCLKIRINLLEHHDSPPEAELSECRGQLAELERQIVARRKADGG